MSNIKEECERWVEENIMCQRTKPLTPHGMVLELETFAKRQRAAGLREGKDIARRYEPDERAKYVTYASDEIEAKAKEYEP